MKKYKFYDLQTGDYSAHDTLEGMTEMLIDGLDDDNDREVMERSYRIGWSEKEMIDFIEMFDYEVQEVSTE